MAASDGVHRKEVEADGAGVVKRREGINDDGGAGWCLHFLLLCLSFSPGVVIMMRFCGPQRDGDICGRVGPLQHGLDSADVEATIGDGVIVNKDA